jgi:hypothetical protein
MNQVSPVTLLILLILSSGYKVYASTPPSYIEIFGIQLDAPELTFSFGQSLKLSSDGTRAHIGGNYAPHSWIYAGNKTLADYPYQLKQTLDTGLPLSYTTSTISGDGKIVGTTFSGSTQIINIEQPGTDLYSNHSIDVVGEILVFSFDGAIAVVGNSGVGGNPCVKVFNRSVNTWILDATLVQIPNLFNGFGSSLALSSNGNALIVGAKYDNSASGAIFFFRRIAGVWVNEGSKIPLPDPLTDSEFGGAVDIDGDGDRAIVGAIQTSKYPGGAAYVYSRQENGTWVLRTVIPSTSNYANNYGKTVAMSTDGSIILVGRFWSFGSHCILSM